MMNMCLNCFLLISNITFTIPLGHRLESSTCPTTHYCISAFLCFFLISGCTLKRKIDEQVAPVSNNTVTGSEINNFTSNVANLPEEVDDKCFVALKFFQSFIHVH